WGDPLIPRFERVIFLSTTTEVRLARLQARERARYGDAIAPGGPLEHQHNDFMAFAIGYETGVFTGSLTGRHRALHEAWLADLPCPSSDSTPRCRRRRSSKPWSLGDAATTPVGRKNRTCFSILEAE
ncbi:MAG TPA: hypothetical protein VKT30_10170, partial [Caulobacteraceae bacterium]|nr:hypothetical protein [Caulobacteraceae bacterium]